MGRVLTPEEVLALVPQQAPFRFIDEILEIDDDHVVATYRFDPDLAFYRGHFPGRPMTPGVILLEAMAQAGVVSQGIYLVTKTMSEEEASRYITVFTDGSVEFSKMVNPGDRVITRSRKRYFRRMKLCCEAEMTLEDGTLVASSTLAGVGVPR